jgi:hypothetical protein
VNNAEQAHQKAKSMHTTLEFTIQCIYSSRHGTEQHTLHEKKSVIVGSPALKHVHGATHLRQRRRVSGGSWRGEKTWPAPSDELARLASLQSGMAPSTLCTFAPGVSRRESLVFGACCEFVAIGKVEQSESVMCSGVLLSEYCVGNTGLYVAIWSCSRAQVFSCST